MKKRLFLILAGCLWLLSLTAPLQAQDTPPLDDVLTQLRRAYENVAAADSYTVEWDEETEQTLHLTRDGMTLDFAFEQEITRSGVVQGANLMGELEYELDQEQTLDDSTIAGGIEINVVFIRMDGQLYLNFDETPGEFRVGLPAGWQPVSTTAISFPAGGEIDPVNLDELVNQLAVDAERISMLFTPEIVTAVEALGEDDIDGQTALGYELTMSLAALVEAQALPLDGLLSTVALSEEALATLLAEADYTMTVWVAVDDERVLAHEISFEIVGELPTPDGETMRLTSAHTQSIELSGFDETYEITAPELTTPATEADT